MIKIQSNLILYLVVTLIILLVSFFLIRNGFVTNRKDIFTGTEKDKQSTTGNPATMCTTDSDCVIKVSVDCCDGYARCFYKDYEPDFEHFKKACREGRPTYLCEHKEVEGCKCQYSYCQTIYK